MGTSRENKFKTQSFIITWTFYTWKASIWLHGMYGGEYCAISWKYSGYRKLFDNPSLIKSLDTWFPFCFIKYIISSWYFFGFCFGRSKPQRPRQPAKWWFSVTNKYDAATNECNATSECTAPTYEYLPISSGCPSSLDEYATKSFQHAPSNAHASPYRSASHTGSCSHKYFSGITSASTSTPTISTSQLHCFTARWKTIAGMLYQKPWQEQW